MLLAICLLYGLSTPPRGPVKMNIKSGRRTIPTAYGSSECDYDTKDQATDNCIKLQRCAGHLMGVSPRTRDALVFA
jgi:hypothetical protein